MDVGLRAILSGWTEAKQQVADVSKELDKVAESTKKVEGANKSGTGAFNEANKAIKQGAEELNTFGRIGTIAGGLIGTALVASVLYMAKSFKEGFDTVRSLGEELNNLSQRTGISAEKLGAMRLSAETSNMSLREFTGGVEQFNRRIDDTIGGVGKGADAFKRLGIEVKGQDGTLKTSDQLLAEVANRFQTMENGAIKTAIAMDLFGRSGAQMIPMLNEGASGLTRMGDEARLAGIVMSEQTVQAAKELNENLRVLKAYGEGFWMEVASPMVRGLAEMTRAMREARKEGAGLFGSLMTGIFSPSSEALQRTQQQFITDINRMEAAKQAAGQSGRRGRWSGIHEQQLQAMYSGLQDLYRRYGVLTGEGEEGPQTTFVPGADPEIARRLQAETKRIQGRQTKEMLQGVQDTVEESEALVYTWSNVDEYIEDAAGNVEVFNRRITVTQKEFKEAEVAREKGLAASRKSWVETAEIMQDSAEDMIFTWDAFGNRLVVTKKQFEEMQGEAKELSQILGKEGVQSLEVFKSFAAGVRGVLVEILHGHVDLGDQIRKIWKGFTNAVIDEFARAMTHEITKPIFEPFKKAFEETGQWIMGNVFSPLWDFIKGGFNDLVSWLGTIEWEKTFSDLVSVFASAFSAFGDFFSADFFAATGLDIIVTRPTKIIAGEAGAERVTITPLGSGGTGPGPGDLGPTAEGRLGEGPATLGNLGRLGLGLAMGGMPGLAQVGLNIGLGQMARSFAEMMGLTQALSEFRGWVSEMLGIPERNMLRAFAEEENVASMFSQAGLANQNAQTVASAIDSFRSSFEAIGGEPAGPDSTADPGPGSAAPSSGEGPGEGGSDTGGGDSDTGGDGFAMGTDMVVSKPTGFRAGERGTERVTVSPFGAAHGHLRGSGPTFVLNGPTVFDDYSMRLFMNKFIKR